VVKQNSKLALESLSLIRRNSKITLPRRVALDRLSFVNVRLARRASTRETVSKQQNERKYELKKKTTRIIETLQNLYLFLTELFVLYRKPNSSKANYDFEKQKKKLIVCFQIYNSNKNSVF
jgi:hypothetical protein